MLEETELQIIEGQIREFESKIAEERAIMELAQADDDRSATDSLVPKYEAALANLKARAQRLRDDNSCASNVC